MSHLTIKNCTIVNEGKLSENDLLIKIKECIEI